jgi:hypothetical protein
LTVLVPGSGCRRTRFTGLRVPADSTTISECVITRGIKRHAAHHVAPMDTPQCWLKSIARSATSTLAYLLILTDMKTQRTITLIHKYGASPQILVALVKDS